MQVIETDIPGLLIIEPKVFGDERGFFMESWSRQVFADAGLDLDFIQDNHSRSQQGILRGLHYQIQHPQGKLVRVTFGSVYDVAIDLRKSSPTFGQWLGLELSETNHRMLWIPPGFAHGFYVTSPVADFMYKCTDIYAPEYERTLRWDDETLAIDWPLVDGKAPMLSVKDAEGTAFTDAEVFA
jgi:dTDP-4-dehydrorhamnose 3,5-epimerase